MNKKVLLWVDVSKCKSVIRINEDNANKLKVQKTSNGTIILSMNCQ